MSTPHSFKPLAREPVYMKVHRAIEADILSGALGEGAVLPTEGQLCAQFRVTRSSVREGIRALEQSGLITRGPAKRLVVTRPRTGDVAAAASRGLTLGGATFAEVWQALTLFYPQAAHLAAETLDEAGVQGLRAPHRRLSALPDADAEGVVHAAVAFFQALAAGLDNRVLMALLQSLNLMIDASLRRVIMKTPQARGRIAGAQSAIIAAIEAGDAGEAQRWMARHIDDLKRGYALAGLAMDAPVVDGGAVPGARGG